MARPPKEAPIVCFECKEHKKLYEAPYNYGCHVCFSCYGLLTQ